MTPATLIAALGGRRSSTFVLTNSYTFAAATQAISWSGATAGDFAVVWLFNDVLNTVSAPAGWTSEAHTDSNTGVATLHTKQLTASDITAGSGTWSGLSTAGGAVIVVYRGPKTATTRSQITSATTSVNLGGFIKGPQTCGVLSIGWQRLGSTPVAPSPFSTRATLTTSAGKLVVAEILKPWVYPSSSQVIWTVASGGVAGWLVEAK